KHGQALNTLDEVDALEQNLLDAILLRADIYLGQLKFEQTARFLEEKLHSFEGRDQIEIMLELSDVYDECEDYNAVFAILKRIVEIDPSNEEALHKISFWADFAEMHDASIALHEKIIDDNPYNA